MPTEWLTPAVLALLAGGAGSMVSNLIRARIDLRKARAEDLRAPVELEHLMIGGSEKTLASVVTALEKSDERIGRLEADLIERDARIEHLEADLTRAHIRIGRLQVELDRLTPPTT